MTIPANDPHYQFADLTLDAARRRVARQGEPIELKALDFDLLRFLVESAPNVVNTDVLAEKVWGRHFVSPENVAQRVMLLRQSLTDDATRPRYIETVRNKGYRLIPVVETVSAATPAAVPRPRRLVHVIATLLAIGLVAAGSYWLAGTAEQPAPVPSSVAVLPFENASPNPDDAYFAVGMQDEIVSQLTKISGLRVFPVRPGRGAHRSAREVVRELNAATVLSGNVYSAEGRVRVNTFLTPAASDEPLWSESYEQERSGIFKIQSEVALDVAQALRLELSPTDRTRVGRTPTTNPQAGDLYLVARARTPLSAELPLAITEVEQALALDAEYKEAWVLDAGLHVYAQFVYPERVEEHRGRSEQAARRAIALDPEFGQAHAALGWSLLTKKDWMNAEAAFRRAAALNVPRASMGPYGFLQVSVGKFNGLALEVYEEARATDSGNELSHRMLAFVHEGRGEWARASGLYDSALRLFERDERAALNLLNQKIHWLVGRKRLEEVRAIQIDDPLSVAMIANLDSPERALELLRQEPDAGGNPVRDRDIGLWAGHFGDAKLALDALRAAIDAQGGQVIYLWLPQLAPMRKLPEFEAYLREIGMVEYWQQYGWPTLCRPLTGDDFECD